MKRKVDGSRSRRAARPRREARPRRHSRGRVHRAGAAARPRGPGSAAAQSLDARRRCALWPTSGYSTAASRASLSEAYRFLRDVEHKLQIVHERQTQVIPQDAEEERLLARRLGYHLGTAPRAAEVGGAPAEVERFRDDLGRYRAAVRRSFEPLFLGARSEIAPRGGRKTSSRCSKRSSETPRRKLGSPRSGSPTRRRPWRTCFACATGRRSRRHPRGARRRCSRWRLRSSAAIRKASDPDQALAHMAELISAIGARTSFLALLEQNPETLKLLVGLFGASRYLSNFFLRHPELLDSLVRADLARGAEGPGVARGGTREPARRGARLRDGARHAAALSPRGVPAHRRQRHPGLLDASQVEEQLSLLADVCLGGAPRRRAQGARRAARHAARSLRGHRHGQARAAGAQLPLRPRSHLRLRRHARRRLGERAFTSTSRSSRSGSWSCSSSRRGRDTSTRSTRGCGRPGRTGRWCRRSRRFANTIGRLPRSGSARRSSPRAAAAGDRLADRAKWSR